MKHLIESNVGFNEFFHDFLEDDFINHADLTVLASVHIIELNSGIKERLVMYMT